MSGTVADDVCRNKLCNIPPAYVGEGQYESLSGVVYDS